MGKNRIVMLLDESGSMQSRFNDVIGGVKGFLKSQSLAPDMLVTLAKFNDGTGLRYVYKDRPIAECTFGSVDYHPTGGTPLLDAVGDVINDTKAGRNGKTLIAIFTDGEENASRRFTKNQVKALIEGKDPRRWQFLYLGVNIDNFDDARSIGIYSGSTRSYGTFTMATGSAGMTSRATQDWYATADSSSIDLPEDTTVDTSWQNLTTTQTP